MPQKMSPKKPALKKGAKKANLEGWLPKNSYVMAKKAPKKLPVATATTQSNSLPIQKPLEFKSLKAIEVALEGCTRCKLCKSRNTIVFGEGSSNPEIMFIGEGPGNKEDEQGRPFVGRSGQLLEKMIEAMGSSRKEVFIANVVKCRPPDNRAPEKDEIAECMPFLNAQIRMLKPKVIVGLGATAVKNLLKTKLPIGELRGQTFELEGAIFIPSLHPAYLLRNPPAKKDAWEDLKKAMKILGWKAKP